MSHLHNKLQNHNNIDLVRHREVVFDTKPDSLSGEGKGDMDHVVSLHWDVSRTRFFTDIQKKQIISKNPMITTREGILMLEVQSSKSYNENKEIAYKELSSIIHVGCKPVKSKFKMKGVMKKSSSR